MLIETGFHLPTENIAVFAAMPSARAAIAVTVKAGATRWGNRNQTSSRRGIESHSEHDQLSQGLRPALAGTGGGLVAAFGLTRLMAGLLYSVKPWDPLAFSLVPVTSIGVARIAVWAPALRASRIDPVQLLRYE